MKWVLIVEPSGMEREYLEKIISQLGYQLYTAKNGKEALHYMNQSLPNTVIVGECLSDYDPIEFCRHVKSDYLLSSPPMLLMNSWADPIYRSAAIQAGFADVVQRPMSIRAFFTKLEMCMFNYRRLCIRAPMEIPVQLLHGTKEHSMKTYNVGERGMYIPTMKPLARKTGVGLQFNLPGLRTLFNFKGQIVHSQNHDTEELPAGMGLQFLDMSPAIGAVLSIYMENFLLKRIPMTL
jgi:CheY-like chemotaxis protein